MAFPKNAKYSNFQNSRSARLVYKHVFYALQFSRIFYYITNNWDFINKFSEDVDKNNYLHKIHKILLSTDMFFMSFILIDFLITYSRVLWAWLIYRLTLKICILVAVSNKLIPDLSAGERYFMPFNFLEFFII